jgi:predicted pyridoxine 5'-phosphate oxidase superfamily flavin-nucleotide-binding protein
MKDSVSGGRLLASTSGEVLLQAQLGTRERADQFYDQQVLDHLNERMREFVGIQEWMFVATSDAHGACDSTLRAGPPGFVAVLDDRRLAWPEYRGNGVMASRGNIVENPHVGLLFVDFAHDRVGLHVNGRARLVDDADIRGRHPDLPVDAAPGRRPEQWVLVEVVEAYIHCSRNVPRLHRHPGDRRHLTHRPAAKKTDYFGAAAAAAGAPELAAVVTPPSPATTAAGPPVEHGAAVWRRRLDRIVAWRRTPPS